MDVPPPLAGYAVPGHGIAAAEHLLDLPGFWPAYLGSVWGGLAHEPEPFGADAADVDAAAEALHDATEVWPAHRVPLPGGRVLWIVHGNLPDEPSTDYLLTSPDRARETRLASLQGHGAGPGLSWRDLVAVAGSAPADAEGVRDPDLRLLLLLPAYGDFETPADEATRRIAAALTTVGVSAEEAPGIAERFLDHPLWPAPLWPSGGEDLLSLPAGPADRTAPPGAP
ncbi:hypothetical protein [Streptomyces sp. Tu 3180]|uniref:hypothetical protein n=1 Tax=Streptomyces sp. Tu 3180 TaxID=2682611 RepID=UPI00135B5822|nr:hypothetical protein [Streptomyces sp. Tu 3180]KAF3464527.1 hypothetical protein GL259_09545 [Streptomyces sp. Tu 3180]